jgi:polyphosphate kinase
LADSIPKDATGVVVPIAPVALDDPSLYLNRELSQISFNRRVLQLAQDEDIPLLERLRFLTIVSNNLDEFFEVRVAELKQRAALDLASASPDERTPALVLARVGESAHQLIEEQYRTLNESLLPALEAAGIRLIKRVDFTEEQSRWVRRFFKREVLPVLTPVGLDPAHPLPIVQNKGLNFIVTMKGEDAFGRESGTAILQVPRCLPRLIQLKASVATGPHDFVMLSSVIHDNVELLFPGMKMQTCNQFRITRNSDLWVNEDEVPDLLAALKGELHHRPYGQAVRLEVPDTCKKKTVRFLLDHHDLDEPDLYQVQGPVNLHRLSALYDAVDRPDLKYPPFTPGRHPSIGPKDNPLNVMREGDIVLHHPYQSFAPVVDLLQRASEDDNVLAIKLTLYRTDAHSPIVDALINASRNGKDVTAIIELRARFDEAANIALATRLHEAGAKVAYGVVGRKCHAKMLLIVRREADGRLHRFVHLGTGNYHTGTARAYTDFSFLTSDEQIGEDVHNIFMQLTSLGKAVPLHRLLHAPFTLHETLLTLIDDEAEAARNGRPARIGAKLNGLTEPKVIQALYRASQAGVQIDLVVRGLCCLRPGMPGVSENIHVRSVLGRFLEHSRIFCFHANGSELVYLSSADWMDRNLIRRVEAATPITNEADKERIIREALTVHLSANENAWTLHADGEWTRLRPKNADRYNSQQILLDELGE